MTCLGRPIPCTLHLTLYTLHSHPTPYTLHPTPTLYTLTRRDVLSFDRAPCPSSRLADCRKRSANLKHADNIRFCDRRKAHRRLYYLTVGLRVMIYDRRTICSDDMPGSSGETREYFLEHFVQVPGLLIVGSALRT